MGSDSTLLRDILITGGTALSIAGFPEVGIPAVIVGAGIGCGNGDQQTSDDDTSSSGNPPVDTTPGEGNPTTQENVCGNGILERGEACEQALMPDELPCSTIDPRFIDGYVDCTDDCRLSLENCVLSGVCGNDILDPGETCDDGNTEDGDGCSANCFSEDAAGAFRDGPADRDIFGLSTAMPDTFCDNPVNRNTFTTATPVNVRVRMHVVRSSAGVLAATNAEVNSMVLGANAYFAANNIQLDTANAGPVDIVSDTSNVFFNFTSDQLSAMIATNNDPAAVDVYIVNTFTNFCGVAPGAGPSPRGDGVVVMKACGGETMAHELGHTLGLWHTHSQATNSSPVVSCDTRGDLCCDTPFDPGPPAAADGLMLCNDPAAPSCVASCSDGSMPDTTNVMSYYSCADNSAVGHFSGEQFERIRCYTDRNYAYATMCNCGTNEGECTSGVYNCASGPSATCIGSTGPTTEICDGKDNDCDGLTDESLVQDCGTDEGDCRKGTETCVGGVWQACEGDIEPVAETCDARDNDCDGRVDNGLMRSCGSSVGECVEGEEVCSYGDWSECLGGVEPQMETCDGRDNDCDGVMDNDVNPLFEAVERCADDGICADGGAAQICEDGAWECVYPAGYVEEECPVTAPLHCGYGAIDDTLCSDGLDNDCDGVTDEHDQYSFCREDPDYWKVTSGVECFISTAGECGRNGGTYKCVSLAESCGVAISCVDAMAPEPETCDGRDMNCNGIPGDRNDIDGDGFGDCPPMDCNEADRNIHPGATEICDGLDNDCDGIVDNGTFCDDGDPCTEDSCGGTAGCVSEEICWEDASTGAHLMWQNPPIDELFTWQEASDYCSNLILGGYNDWRMPNFSELRSLIRGCRATMSGGEVVASGCDTGANCCESLSFPAGPVVDSVRYALTGYGCERGLGPDENGCYWDESLSGDCSQINGSWSSTHSGCSDPSSSHYLPVDFSRGAIGGTIDVARHIRCVR